MSELYKNYVQKDPKTGLEYFQIKSTGKRRGSFVPFSGWRKARNKAEFVGQRAHEFDEIVNFSCSEVGQLATRVSRKPIDGILYHIFGFASYVPIRQCRDCQVSNGKGCKHNLLVSALAHEREELLGDTPGEPFTFFLRRDFEIVRVENYAKYPTIETDFFPDQFDRGVQGEFAILTPREEIKFGKPRIFPSVLLDPGWADKTREELFKERGEVESEEEERGEVDTLGEDPERTLTGPILREVVPRGEDPEVPPSPGSEDDELTAINNTCSAVGPRTRSVARRTNEGQDLNKYTISAMVDEIQQNARDEGQNTMERVWSQALPPEGLENRQFEPSVLDDRGWKDLQRGQRDRWEAQPGRQGLLSGPHTEIHIQDNEMDRLKGQERELSDQYQRLMDRSLGPGAPGNSSAPRREGPSR